MRLLFFSAWLFFLGASEAQSMNPAQRPTIFLIGDSTVRNGRGDGAGGLWGWGDFLAAHFDTNKVKIVNRALGGRSSRTFLTEGLWEKVRQELHKGDFVLMQFGHNDGGEIADGDRPRASLKDNGDESQTVVIQKTGQSEVVHTFGWYLRRYIAETKAAGATPIVLSPIPRNIWSGGKVVRASSNYGRWASEAAANDRAFFVDLNELIARRYEQFGEKDVAAELFTTKDHTHTTKAGAALNAECAAAGLRELKGAPMSSLFASKP